MTQAEAAARELALEALINCDLAFEECKDYPITHDLVIQAITALTAIKEAQPKEKP